MGVCSGRLEWAAGGGLSGQSKCTIACLLQQQQQQQKVVVGSSTSTSATARDLQCRGRESAVGRGGVGGPCRWLQ